ncbi:Ger(x)C family spore germination protein [Falsibacillus pallidus]|uniref:Ger(x)C family spore germination protein n=1 Tax=Falsibacillus pallidus TaxID=493781 RepID=UPI003D97D1DE
MKKRILMLSIILTLLAGCGSQHELNEMSIIVGVGIDLLGKDNYQITLQIVNPSAIFTAGGNSSGQKVVPIINVVGTGSTVVDALQKATTKISRPNFYAHLSMIVIGQALAEKGILEVLDTFERDAEVRQNTPILVAKNERAFDVLNTLTTLTSIPVVSLIGKIRNAHDLFGETANVELYQLIKSFEDGNTAAIVGGATAPKDNNFASTKENIDQASPLTSEVEGIAVFNREGKLAYWIDNGNARSTLILRNELKETILSHKCSENKHFSIKISYSKSKVNAIRKNGKVILQVNTYMEGNVDSNACPKITLSTDEDYEKMEKIMEKKIKQNLNDLIKETQSHETDFLNFSTSLRKSNPEYWKKERDHWGEIYKNAAVDVKVEMKINNSGLTRNHINVKEANRD